MFSAVREILRFLSNPTVTLFLIFLVYFWTVWGLKFIFSRFYRPAKNKFSAPMSIIVPTYHESRDVLTKALEKILRYPKEVVAEVIIVTDQREGAVAEYLKIAYAGESRVKVVSSPPGKRSAVALGVTTAECAYVSVIESDTFVDDQTLIELIKPLADERVGGVVGDQRIYKPYDSLVNFFNTLAEGIKYAITVPALSVFGDVTVLGGRCVAFRKSAVLPLMEGLVGEKFLGKQCISGDDGRLTSLLLEAGWRTVYQSTAIVYTVSPPIWRELGLQRLRWARNSCRRTLRGLLGDGFWVWKKPVVALQMLSVWGGTFMMFVVLYTLIISIWSTSWFWFGTTPEGIIQRVVVLIIGMTITRMIRIHPILGRYPVGKWVWIPLFPWYLCALWVVRLYAIVTMNKQGWITRQDSGAGGFKKRTKSRLETLSKFIS